MPSDARNVLRPAPDDAAIRSHRDSLEPAILETFARRKVTPRAPRRPWLQLALAGLVAAGAGVVACQLPAEYERPLGQRIGIILPASKFEQVDPERMAAFVEANHPIEGLMMRVEAERHGEEPGVVRFVMDVVGPDVDVDAIWDDLVDEYPVLEGGRVEGEVMEGIVHGTLGGRIGSDLFDLRIDEGDIDEARARLLEDLRARGIEGAEIEIEEEQTPEGVRRRVEVRLDDELHRDGG
jgi:hypothetical protein